MLVELCACVLIYEAVEIRKELRLRLFRFFRLLCVAHKVIDEYLGVNFLLDVERRRADHQV